MSLNRSGPSPFPIACQVRPALKQHHCSRPQSPAASVYFLPRYPRTRCLSAISIIRLAALNTRFFSAGRSGISDISSRYRCARNRRISWEVNTLHKARDIMNTVLPFIQDGEEPVDFAGAFSCSMTGSSVNNPVDRIISVPAQDR